MKANELRIGNWVYGDRKKPYQFEISDFSDWLNDHNSHEFGDHIHPIPLTEEWLLKFGFEEEEYEKIKINWWNLPKSNPYQAHHLMKMQNSWTWFIDFDDSGDNTHLVKGFDFVHQLQNLYFALCGEELKINM